MKAWGIGVYTELKEEKGSKIVARLAHPAPTQSETAVLMVLSDT